MEQVPLPGLGSNPYTSSALSYPRMYPTDGPGTLQDLIDKAWRCTGTRMMAEVGDTVVQLEE